MKIKILTLSIFVFFTVSLSTAQKTKPSFLNKTNQHSVSAEFAALSYSFAHKFKKNVTFGARVQLGLGLQFIIASTSTMYDYGYGNGLQKVKPGVVSYDFIKLQLFYRHILSNSFYFEIGPTASRKSDIFMESGWENGNALGLETSAYYYTGKIHLGLRIGGTMNFERYDSNMFSDDTYYLLLITPLVIGFNF